MNSAMHFVSCVMFACLLLLLQCHTDYLYMFVWQVQLSFNTDTLC